MPPFVSHTSIVRKIWGKADTILFIFAGASAEFALNRSVDWFYYTGRLPADPLGRLFSTVTYARSIVFSEHEAALRAIDQITGIHRSVEDQRGETIPASAYRDVLFMLIDYSIRSYTLLERPLREAEKTEVFNVFYQVGARMQIPGLPETYRAWEVMRAQHLQENLIKSDFSADLYQQYRKHLGAVRYMLLMQVQARLVPGHVKQLLGLGSGAGIAILLPLYKLLRILHVHTVMRNALLPAQYLNPVVELDVDEAKL
ncbi:oxygenase MpaB family protein [Dyadobacter sandarakinus]|uniref:DUF2236 domain-containing protein n=1 Tax=Dyadobacter sandarakinus TaxID=2747268 RepID=A0ABX7I3N3_9BACT|nr:oxygenase MpaB family protein [Dyadobacter sandarakinus]QRQ99852.1 DUF2236 domain-containing protein [Dyadobacter sandarakinus]